MYLKSDEFIKLCHEHRFDIKSIQSSLIELGMADKSCKPYKIRHRISNLQRKGLLPLDSGNFVDKATVLRSLSTLVDSTGNVKLQWIKSDVAKEDQLLAFQAAVESIVATIPSPPAIPIPQTQLMSNLLTVYPIGDAHIGMLAHAPETGADNDLVIAESHLVSAMDMLVSQANPSTEAYIVDLGDYMHADNSENRTAASGHSLDVDGRYHKVLEVALRTTIRLINLALTKHETVYWRSVTGNHNEHSAIMMNLFIKAYYHNEPRVIVRSSPAAVDYFQFGKVLLATTHGHTIKAERLAQIIPVDCSDIWSSTKFRYALTGHVHHQSVKEYPTCIVETFRTLAGKDAWHASSGYRSGQDMHCITYHRNHGEVARSKVNLSHLTT